jgi:peroxiredoxin
MKSIFKKGILLTLLFIFLANILVAQKKKSFQQIFIVNDEIVSREKINDYMKNGFIKGMKNGISEDEYIRLKKKLGDTLGEKEFIAVIDVFSKSEMRKKKRAKKAEKAYVKKFTKEYILKSNDAAVDFTVEMVNGEQIQLSDLKGKVVLLNFWATWCAPCIREFYEMPSKILEVYKNEDFVFIPIAIGEDKALVSKKMDYLKGKGIVFNAAFDPKGAIWNHYAKGAIPKNFIIDKKGIIRFTSTGNGEKNVDNLAHEIESLLKE